MSHVASHRAEVELVGISRNIMRIRTLIDQVAQTGFNVIVCGETGVGKELVVSSLYLKSNRVGKPFVKVNCAALPDTLLESEMFGYERGAFTGAIRTRRGKFEQAHEGVLFLDEIGDMSLPLQSKLLHVLQGGDFTPLGSEKPFKPDVWVIAATNRDLRKDVETYYKDDTFPEYFTKIKTHVGAVRISYHFFRKAYDAVQQANFFIDYINPYLTDDDILCLDFEEGGETASQLWAFINQVQKRKPKNRIIIYSRANLMNAVVMTNAEKTFFKQFPSWIAGYPYDPNGFDEIPSYYRPDYTKWGATWMWRYTDSLRVKGIEGDTEVINCTNRL